MLRGAPPTEENAGRTPGARHQPARRAHRHPHESGPKRPARRHRDARRSEEPAAPSEARRDSPATRASPRCRCRGPGWQPPRALPRGLARVGSRPPAAPEDRATNRRGRAPSRESWCHRGRTRCPRRAPSSPPAGRVRHPPHGASRGRWSSKADPRRRDRADPVGEGECSLRLCARAGGSRRGASLSSRPRVPT